ncbi:MAG TPA: DUF3299 domain-containing protein [Opitutaceae bacterium]|nr:DUF3299 domain-containing protein [Opitutaceae bacterium]
MKSIGRIRRSVLIVLLAVPLALGRAENDAKALTFADLKQDAAGYWEVGFQHLASFSFGQHKFNAESPAGSIGRRRLGLPVPGDNGEVEWPTEPGQSGSIPAKVRALDGRRVCITGYMLPTKEENGRVKECLLLRNQMMCCFGRRPELNEWVVVKMKGAGVQNKMDTPIVFYGTLHVGEMFENHVFEGLYELDGEKISIP